MKLRFLLAALTAMTVATVSSKPITPDEALARLSVETNVPSAIRSKILKGTSSGTKSNLTQGLRLDKTVTTSSNAAALYLYRSDDTMWILPADDSVTSLLGYVDVPANQQAMPEQLQWLLNEYAREIEYIRCHSDKAGATSLRDETDSREPIAPLVTTTWDQTEPYYNLCPVIDDQRCLTGCAATAMAQVLNYAKYPDRAVGSVSYTDEDGHVFEADLAEEAIDWNNMLDHYESGQYTEEQAHAVAYLMKVCGYASSMYYSPIESGTDVYTVYKALLNHMNVNRNCAILSRNDFTLPEWENLVYEHLQKVGPLLYSGNDCVGGHAFVCDGYSANGYFHFNWGWSSWYDGYFKLSALVPTGQGAGGNAGGYNFGQDVIFNITAPDKATLELPQLNNLLLCGNLTAKIDEDGALNISSSAFDYIGVIWYNTTSPQHLYSYGLKFTNTDTEEVHVADINVADTLAQYHGTIHLTVGNLSFGLLKGKYKVQVVSHTEESSEWQELRHTSYCNDYFYANIDNNGNLVSVEDEEEAYFTITHLRLPNVAYIGKKISYSYTVTNNTQREIFSGLRPIIFYVDDDYDFEVLAYGDAVAYDMNPGDTSEAKLVSTITIEDEDALNNFLNADERPQAFIGLVSTDYGALLNYQIATFDKAPETTMTATMEYDGDVNNVTDATMTFTCNVTCKEGYFLNAISIFLTDENNNLQHFSSSENYTLLSGESVNLTMTHTFTNLAAGALYNVSVGQIENYVAEPFTTIQIRMADSFCGVENVLAGSRAINVNANHTTGVVNVSAPSDIASVDVYAIDGRAYHLNAAINGATATASLNAIPNGVSIVKVTLKNGIGYSSKIMK
jgi:hypothetical protein